MNSSQAASLTISVTALAWLAIPDNAMAAAGDPAAAPLLTKYNCQACHALDKKLVGPSYKEIAVKYAGDGAAPAKLEQKVKKGGSGVWGAVPMPPNNVPDADLKTVVAWILAQK